MRYTSLVPSLSLLLLLASCGHVSLDRSQGYGGDPVCVPIEEVPVMGYHVVIDVALNPGEEEDYMTFEGELIAAEAGFLYLLQDDVHPIRVSRALVTEVHVDAFPAILGSTLIWSATGLLSTISHGAFALLSGPAWLLTGIFTGIAAASDQDPEAETDAEFDLLYQYARFPAGLPPQMRDRFGGSRP